MLTERDLLKAIAECETEPLTSAKISKLADLYTVYDHLFGYDEAPPLYSHAEPVEQRKIKTNGDTEFLKLLNGKDMELCLTEIDELVSAIQALHPKMYERLLRNLENK